MTDNAFRIAVMPGDGIGHEVMAPTLELLDAVAARVGGFDFVFEHHAVGAQAYLDSGTALSDETITAAGAADAILFGAAGDPAVRYPDGTEIAPQLTLREHFELYAGVRPIRALPASPAVLTDVRAADIDFVIVRESTEGLFASRRLGTVEDDVARGVMEITRATSEKLFDFSFDLASQRRARGRPGRLTCVDKANVITALAFFRQIFDQRAANFPEITADHAYVDATALDLVRQPWNFDVLVTENMFGDILSDLGAALIGGMGFAPSADIGDKHAVFQPCHGSAPDIAGQGLANPAAMFLSAALMLEWLSQRHGLEACREGAELITAAVDGSSAGTAEVASAVMARIAGT
ncbi:MAG: isocitrate/isopropylmalate family dehydrogenase [Alphaproteobacteria bacterium]|jgi:3-isopropylmalate dehydrogenase|nr:3-isopropylmalate dehydrogenase [Rhodospirillaceae bacterium]MDP6406202.1 isocitrate/isopropylmalate family dehydrogenase [Alphaproteobacteria bacterium]MDP6621112.1 isocitrate/isopropylmalate family dehydrogenase [Alphaproteobacteria bacterium]|tara:strand:+ start:99 stop:1151 length:1053 start_codon:yes stop_codon:yes gene_type:complete